MKGGDFMERDINPDRSIHPDQGRVLPGNLTDTHPLAKVVLKRTEPGIGSLRASEELAMATGREEVLNQPE